MNTSIDLQSRLDEYFQLHQSEFIDTISRLIAVRSVNEPAKPGMPFGEGPAKALALALEIAGEMGFSTRNYDNYVGTADLNGNETKLAILSHLDVVDEGTGWSTPPYQPVVKDGMIYGRGSSDDKGPSVAAIFAMKAVKELGIPLKYNTRLILGTDEELGSSDIAYYFKQESAPPYTFSPDGNFPVLNTEKGHFQPYLSKTWQGSAALPRVLNIQAGVQVNVIPAQVQATLEGFSQAEVQPYCEKAAAQTGTTFELTQDGSQLTLTVHGKNGHGAAPQKANNALTALIEILASLPLAASESASLIHAFHAFFPHGDFYGNALGIAQSEEITGPLTLSFNMLSMNETGMKARFDSRTPLCATQENSIQIVLDKLSAAGIEVKNHVLPPHHTPADSAFVQTLLRIYEQYTGQPGYCESTGGGTYVHEIEGGVCFGANMPGFEPGAHSPDEHASIADLITAAKIYAQAIMELCSG